MMIPYRLRTSRRAPSRGAVKMHVGWCVLSLALLAAVVAASSALAGGNDTSFTVTSSLDGRSVLPLRSHWIAYPQIDPSQGQIAEVDYLIDGFRAWTAHSSPWYYGDNGNWLVTTILKPGLHTFTVRAVVADKVAVDKFQAHVVAPPKPPARLAGSWSRAGRTLFIGKTGWGIGSNQFFDARYLANGTAVLGPEIIDRPEQPPTCGANPPQSWKVVLSASGNHMQLSPIGSDPCRTRLAALHGMWTLRH
jgi:hypothetical protein